MIELVFVIQRHRVGIHGIKKKIAYKLLAQPSVFMDFHLYDYQILNARQRAEVIACWIKKVRNVYGQIAILWLPHTFTKNYGWLEGFNDLLNTLKETSSC